MPVIPSLGTPTVRPQPVASRMGALESYGVDQRATQAVAGGLADVAAAHEREVQRFDEIRANEAEAALTSQATELWTGYANQRGTHAVEGLDSFRDTLTRRIREQEGGLATERQKLLFRSRADRIAQDLDGRAQAHAAGEVRAVDEASHRALLDADREAILNRPGDADATIARAVDRLALYGDRNGMPHVEIEQARTELRSNLRLAQTLALANTGTETGIAQASAILKDHGDQFTFEDRKTARKVVGGAQEQQGITRTAERILRSAGDDQQKAEAMLAEVPLEHRGDVRKLVKAEFDARDEAKTRQENVTYEAAATKVDQGTAPTARQRVGEPIWQSLTAAHKDALDRRVEQAAGKTIANGADARVWQQFYLMPAADLAKLSPADFDVRYYSRLDPAHQDRALELYKKAQGDPTGAGHVGAGIMTDQQLLSRMFAQVFQMDPTVKASAKAFSDYEYQVNLRVLAESNHLKRPLGDAEKQTLMLEVARKMTAVPVAATERNARGWSAVEAVGNAMQSTAEGFVPSFSTGARIVLGAGGRVRYADIPAAINDSLANVMRRNGIAPTQPRIEAAYTAQFFGDQQTLNRLLGAKVNPADYQGLAPRLGFPGVP